MVKKSLALKNSESGQWQGEAARPLLTTALNDSIAPGAFIVFCAEPGMGKSDALEIARTIAKQRGAHNHYFNLTGLTQECACDRVVRESRKLIRAKAQGSWSLVCFRGVPAMDERCVHRMRTQITRLRNLGFCVVVTLCPEAIQLVDSCADAYILWPDELCVTVPEKMGSHNIQEIYQLTANTPYLANSLMITERDGDYEISAGREYHNALCCLISLTLRPSIMYEERRLRLAMMLLGSGTFLQLQEVLGTLDPELLQDMCRFVPLMGVDMRQASFSCAGMARTEWLAACVHVLRDILVDEPVLCARIAQVLLRKGNTERAGIILGFSEEHEEGAAITLRWCMELVNVGHIDVIRRALSTAVRLQICSPQLRRACATLLKLVDNARLESKDIDLDPRGALLEEERDQILRISLLLASRLVWQGRPGKVLPEAPALSDPLARDLVLHLSVVHALVEGRGHAAYHLLVCGSQLTGVGTLAGQLLEADLACAHLLMGLPYPSATEGTTRKELGGACMLCYLSSLPEMDAVWREGSSSFMVEELDIRANQVGDELVRAYYLLSGAIANARRGAVPHAVVKCERALAIAKRCKVSIIADAAHIVSWAARINAGDMPSAEEFAQDMPQNAGMQALAQILEAVAAETGETPPHLREVVLDRDIAWLASSLLSGFSRLSLLLERVMPPTWLVVIESMHARVEDETELQGKHADRQNNDDLPEHSVYVRLLGGLEVFVNGMRMPEGSFERRRAKTLLTYCCSSTEKRMRRIDVIDAVWPESINYEQGNRRLYAATSVINQQLKEMDAECRFFATVGADHAMMLDETYVNSDVKEFEQLAHHVMRNEGDDVEVLSLVRSAQDLYGGDLCLCGAESGGVIDRRRIELRNLYTDVLVAGAEAALRRGTLRLATRLCEQALLTDNTREDANSCLVKALIACGRINEADERQRSFLARMGTLKKERKLKDKTEG